MGAEKREATTKKQYEECELSQFCDSCTGKMKVVGRELCH